MIEAQFAIKEVSVDESLAKTKAKVSAAASDMDKSLNKTGDGAKVAAKGLEDVSKGMDSVQKMGGRAGGTMKNFTDALKGMLSPAGLASAAFAGLTALIIREFEKAKAKVEQFRKTYEWELKQAQDASAKERGEAQADAQYMQRLQQISDAEFRSNEMKDEAVKIIDRLTGRYGDLGLSIDAVTGNITGLNEAMKRQGELALEFVRNSARAELASQAGLVGSAIKATDNSIWGAGENANLLRRYAPMSKEESAIVANANRQYAMPAVQAQADEIRKRKLDEAKAAKEIMDADNDDLDALKRKIDLTARLSRNTDFSQKEQESWQKANAELQKYYEILFRLRNLDRFGNETGTIAQAAATAYNPVTTADDRVGQTALKQSLMDQAKARQDVVRSIQGLLKMDMGGSDIRTDALRQRGGYVGRAVTPDADRVNQRIADGVTRQVGLLGEIKSLVKAAQEI